MWVDSHCHLSIKDYGENLENVIQRAREAGIEHFLMISCDLCEISPMLTLAGAHPDISITAGIHPHEATQTLKDHKPQAIYDHLKDAAGHTKVVGFGEMGYDFYYSHSDPEDQEKLFDLQLQLAQELQMPVSIHTRDAEKETLNHLKKYPNIQGVIHCFSGTDFLARGALDLGFYISLSGILTFPKAAALREIAASLPMDRLLLETDCPFLTPVPHRGEKNEPAHLIHTAKVLADIKGVDVSDLAKATTENFYRLFSKARMGQKSP